MALYYRRTRASLVVVVSFGAFHISMQLTNAANPGHGSGNGITNCAWQRCSGLAVRVDRVYGLCQGRQAGGTE